MQENTTSYFNLESPPEGVELPAGRQQLRGWLVPKSRHHFVDVRARVGTRSFPGVHGFPRADLAAHFDPSRSWLPAEFLIDVDFLPGAVDVQIEALDLTSQWQSIHTVHLVIKNAASLVQPPPDPVSAVEFGRAMQLLLISRPENNDGSSTTTIADALPYPRVVRPDHLPFRGYIAEPAAVAPAFYGQMEVVGWLFHEAEVIKRAFITTDLVTFQPLEIGGEFAGVSARFSSQPQAKNCRLSGFVDVSSGLPSPACVRIFAELSDGSMHLCLASHCRPLNTEEIKKTCAPFSLWKFWQDWRGLKQTLANRGMELETSPALREEFWKTFRRCRQIAAPRNPSAVSNPPSLPQAPANRKLRLLLITHNLNFEGAPLLFVEYARYLVEKCGAEITVLTGREGPLRHAFEVLGASVTLVDIQASTPAKLSQRVSEASRGLDWSRIDLVVANTLACFWGVTLAHSAKRPSLLYIHESTSPAAFFSRTTPRILPAVYRAFLQASAVSFNTPATQAYYSTLGSGNNFHLNSAWIDLTALDAFRTGHDRNALRNALALRPDELLVANIGTICERKGQHDFLRAVEWLWRSSPALAARCRFVMVGGRETRYNQGLQKESHSTRSSKYSDRSGNVPGF